MKLNIRFMSIFSLGIVIDFIWMPSHIGLQGNEIADRLAWASASKFNGTMVFSSLPKSHHEVISFLHQFSTNHLKTKLPRSIIISRKLISLLVSFRLNTWKIKFSRVNAFAKNSSALGTFYFTAVSHNL